ncbi:MAG TPA: autotransporter outer membrane beta-barrel domain-containing protein [Bradyrhizobium sp.]|nr:autotransporter outer membrane beta-barrel domain-containing protein [Bradyrhizobium sp.]
MKQKIALAAAAVSILFTGAASAADLAARPYTKAPPVAVAIYDWTGFYIGANGGWASSRKSWDYVTTAPGPLAPGPEGSHRADGGVVGGQIGYRWQTANWVFGVEAQGDWADLNGSNVSLRFPLVTNRSRIDGIGLFTGQVGYAWNNALLYVRGGAAVVHDKYDYFPTATGIVNGTASETRWGGVVGVGAEFGFAPNWSLGINYDHAFLGSRGINFTQAAPVPAVVSETIRQDLDMVTARISYRFGGPIVARY